MIISLIVAVDNERGIEVGGNIPWMGKVPADMKLFKERTMGHPVIMGRTTYSSIGRALPGRSNIVLTHAERFTLPDAIVCNSIAQALEHCATLPGNDEVFIIGGGSVYAQTIHLADRIYRTLVDSTFGADTFFPEMPEREWRLTGGLATPADEKNQFGLCFTTHERKR
jgi:dihydrofolate reductase